MQYVLVDVFLYFLDILRVVLVNQVKRIFVFFGHSQGGLGKPGKAVRSLKEIVSWRLGAAPGGSAWGQRLGAAR